MTNERFHDLFGGPPRRPDARLERRHMDLAASIQSVTEDIFLGLGNAIHRETGVPGNGLSLIRLAKDPDGRAVGLGNRG